MYVSGLSPGRDRSVFVPMTTVLHFVIRLKEGPVARHALYVPGFIPMQNGFRTSHHVSHIVQESKRPHEKL